MRMNMQNMQNNMQKKKTGGRYCCVGETHVLIIVLCNISTYRRAKVCLKLWNFNDKRWAAPPLLPLSASYTQLSLYVNQISLVSSLMCLFISASAIPPPPISPPCDFPTSWFALSYSLCIIHFTPSVSYMLLFTGILLSSRLKALCCFNFPSTVLATSPPC